MSITIELDTKRTNRLELICNTLNIDASEAVSEALDVFIRKLATEGKIPIEASISGLDDSETETVYDLKDIPDIHDDRVYGLTARERARGFLFCLCR